MVEIEEIIVATFYKFVPLEDFRDMRRPLLAECHKNGILGTILLAEEGINATIAGTRKGIDALMEKIYLDQRLTDLEYKEAVNLKSPFYRMKVKLRNEIVALGVPDIDPNNLPGICVSAENWNSLIKDPEVLVIDVRNKYECDIGTFKNAISSGTETFRDFPEYVKNNLDPKKNKKIAMYCTGGIRCEKASAYMLNQGFNEVYQLQGGILRYIDETETDKSLWQGECFVFDARVAVDHALQKGGYDQCYSCRHPVSPEDKRSRSYQEGVSCPYCYNTLTVKRRKSLEERQRQVKLAEKRNQQHIGVQQPNNSDRVG